MTNNTREVEEVVKEFYKIFDTDNLWQGEDEWTKNVPIGNIEQWLRTTLHHQLQKAREEQNTVLLAYQMSLEAGNVADVLTDIKNRIKVYHPELDQEVSK